MTSQGAHLLRAARDDLEPAEAKVADTLIGAGAQVLGLPVADIASMAGTSQATVVRLAQRLGYRGFRDLRLDLVREAGASSGRTVFEEIGPSDTPESVVKKVAAIATRAIDDTSRLLDAITLTRIVEALGRAPRIEVYGVGSSGIVALDAAAKLRRLALPACSYPDAHQQAQSASLLTHGCVALAFSHSGATRDVVEAASIAGRAGATIVGITSFPLSPLARAADHVLLTGAADEPTDRSGSVSARLAQLYLADVLTVCYSLAHYAASQEALARSGAAVEGRRGVVATRRRGAGS
jgi:DNA-binding MurR/RpiR family transcriptional regulator